MYEVSDWVYYHGLAWKPKPGPTKTSVSLNGSFPKKVTLQ